MRELDEMVVAARDQADAMALLEALADATRGTASPAMLDELTALPMSPIRAQTAFQNLKNRGLIDANFGVFYAARLSTSGHAMLAAHISQNTIPSTSAIGDDTPSEIALIKPSRSGKGAGLKAVARRIRHLFKAP